MEGEVAEDDAEDAAADAAASELVMSVASAAVLVGIGMRLTTCAERGDGR